MSLSKTISRMLHKLTMALAIAFCGVVAHGQGLNISDAPLFLNGSVAPLNLLVLGRDHKLFYEAYADHSDLNDDDVLDIGYKGYEVNAAGKFKIDYYGYFDPYKCYTYGTYFTPVSTTADKKCPGQWSGDFLNYITTSRIDALRKVLYGGSRWSDNKSTDSPAFQTILQRSVTPQDAHSWGKEYAGLSDGYDIHDYTPYNVPTTGTRHLFANTTLMTSVSWTTNNNPPLLRVAQNQPYRIWEWVSIESPVAGAKALHGVSGTNIVGIEDFSVRVEVCKTGLLEPNCKQYPSGNYKPTGLLQDFGENDGMLFGLLTGSYAKSKSGGVIRKDIGTITNEINTTTDGTFTSVTGIIRTIDQLRIAGYTNYVSSPNVTFGVRYPDGLNSINRPFNEPEHGGNWGNPVAEMMYEGLRYFAGKSGPTSGYNYTAAGSYDATAPLSLPKVDAWSNPYGGTKPFCAKPFETVMSDVNVSFDSDQLPGSTFNTTFANDLPGAPALNVTTLGDSIWTNEIGGSGKYFIGQSNSAVSPESVYDGAPSAKTVTSFSNIRGLSPEEPTKQGSYYAASVAYYGLTTDINTVKTGAQKPQTFAVALASPLPRIDIPVSTPTGTKKISLVPFAKTVKGVGGCTDVSNTTPSGYQPTNQIVDFYVESLTPTSGTFQVSFEDVETGNDHDMDALARYTYTVNADNTVKIRVSSDYASGCFVQHLGYVISGTTHDGTYLEVRDKDTLTASDDRDYFLDTPDSFTGTPPAPNSGAGTWNDGLALGTTVAGVLFHERTFTVGSGTTAGLLKDPLWYAAKWGGFTDSNGNNRPDLASEWDEDGNGDPDNYFLVTNALRLKDQLGSAFKEIVRRTGSASSASVNAGSISSETRVYQAKFNSGDWTGQLLSFPVNTDGTLAAAEWDAATVMPAAASRHIITTDSNLSTANGVAFTWTGIGAGRQAQLANGDGSTVGSSRVDFLRGDQSTETQNGGTFRNRPLKLGDIVSSSPMFVGKPPFFYPDDLETAPYSTFVSDNVDRRKMVYAGANDGMLHAFNATSGAEELAFIPGAVFGNLHFLSDTSYTHRFYVDGTPTIGDVFYAGDWHSILVGGLNKGGKSIYALDVTNPSATSFTEGNADNIFRWEYTDTELGYTYSRPAIVRMHNGKWAAVFGNGYNNSGDGHAYLYVVDIETGAKIAKIDTGAGSTATPNGLATPAVVDLNGDSIVDYVYAGDLLGNMWKFNVTGSLDTSWAVAYTDAVTGKPAPLYVALDPSGVRQPITSKPEVGRGPRGLGMMIYFGTGKYMELADKSPTQTQTFYAVNDPNALNSTDQLSGRGLLTRQSIISEQTVTIGTVTSTVRVTTENAVSNRGWFLDLLAPPYPPGTFQGEMQVSDSILRNGRIIFTTLIPDVDLCSAGGSSWLMELDGVTGARLRETPFDLNNDGQFNTSDYVNITLADGSTVSVPISAMRSEVGIAQRPGILSGEGAEYKYLSGSAQNSAMSNIQRAVENPGPNARGRQSWRQIK